MKRLLVNLAIAVTGADVIVDRLFPSVPRHLQGRIIGGEQTPAPSEEGEATAGAGQTPESEVAPATPSERATVEHAMPRSPGSPLPCEYAFWWVPHPSRADEFADDNLAALLDTWATEDHR